MSESNITADRVRRALQSRYNPISSLTPQYLSASLDSFAQGYIGQAARLWDVIERRDDKIAACRRKRISALARYGFEILTVDTGDDESLKKEAQQHAQVLQYFFDNLTVTNALDENQRGGFSLLVRQMADAIGKKYSVHEIVWQPGTGMEDGGLTAEFRFAPLWFFENRTGRLRFLETDGAFDGVEMDPRQWLVAVGDGIMEACSVAYMFKRMPLQDWMSYCEKFGIPGLHAETSAVHGSTEWNAVVEAVRNFMNDWGAVTSQGTKFNLLSPSGGGSLPFESPIERMDRAIAILWRGADLSTMSAGAGAGQGASVQGGESDLLEQDDAQWISETLQMQLGRQVIRYHFGDVRPMAYVQIKTRAERDVRLDMDLLKVAAELGVPVSIDDARQRLGLPTPDSGAALIQRPSPQPAGPLALLGNERQDAKSQGTKRFIADAKAQLTSAFAKDLQPVFKELEKALQGDDITASLAAFRDQLPDLVKKVGGNGAAADQLSQILSASFFNGLEPSRK